jgi:MFS family permease
MNLKKNIFLYYVVTFFSAFIFLIPIWSFFFVNYLHFSFWWALFITILSGWVSFIFEIPSWAWADRFGRKRTYILGLIFILFWFSFYLWADSIIWFLVAWIFEWIWFAMTSWNLESLIHDNLIENKTEKAFKNISAHSYVYGFIWRGLSSLVAGYLFVIDPLLPVFFTIGAYFIVLILLFFITESEYHKPEKTTNLKHIKATFQFVFEHKVIYIFFILMFFQSGLGNVYWFTYQPYLKSIWFDIWFIGIIFAILSFISAFWSYILKRLQDKFETIFIVKIILYAIGLSALFFYFVDNKLWLIPVVLLAITSGFVMPLWNNFLSSQVSSSKKSTLLSIFSFVITLWYFSFSILAWFLVDIIWLKQLYLWVLLLCVLLFLVDILYFRKLKFRE